MKIKLSILIVALLLPSLASSEDTAKTKTIGPQVLKIDGKDERAVIKTLDGKMQVIKPGDVLRVTGSASKKDEKSLRVVEIAEGRVVLQEKNGNATETVIIRLENGKQRVERVKKTPEKQEKVNAAAMPQEQKQEGKEPPKGKKKEEKR
jgi:hypothetical protein